MDNTKPKKRGRPRKNVEKTKPTIKNNNNKEENIVCFLALSDSDSDDKSDISDNSSNSSNSNDSDSNDSDSNDSKSSKSNESSDDLNSDSDNDNRFTVNDTESKRTKKKSTILSISENNSDSDSSSEVFGANKCTNIKTLIEEIKKRDLIIKNLRGKGAGILSTYTATRQNNIDYHCTIVANSETGKVFTPKETHIHCWWCDHGFDTLPVYIPNIKMVYIMYLVIFVVLIVPENIIT
jgi:hypothetical protein